MKLGYKIDIADPRDRKIGSLLASRGVTGLSKRKVSWLDKCAPVRDQPAQNCVNEALSRAVHTNAEIASTPIEYPSCLANYGMGRTLDHGPDITTLPDEGSFPRLVMQSARQFGMVPISAYGDNESPFVPVDFNVVREASHAKLTGFYRADVDDDERLCAAIEGGDIPIIGRQVGDDYINVGTEIYDGRKSSVRGGHMEAIVGFDLDAPLPYFEIMGSWGTGFARYGVALCSIRSVMLEAFDKYVVTGTVRF